MQAGVSILVATHDANLRPNQTRAFGCLIDPATDTLDILISAPQATALLADIRANGAIAAVFCRPSSSQALQIKAIGADTTDATAKHMQAARQYRDNMIAEIQPLGFRAEMLGAVFTVEANDLTVIRCRPHVVFEQTPGPNAGNALASSETTP